MAMFHRSTDEVNKNLVLKDFPKVNTALRVVIATSAFGMGIDVLDVARMIFHSVPRSMESFTNFCRKNCQFLFSTGPKKSNNRSTLLSDKASSFEISDFTFMTSIRDI